MRRNGLQCSAHCFLLNNNNFACQEQIILQSPSKGDRTYVRLNIYPAKGKGAGTLKPIFQFKSELTLSHLLGSQQLWNIRRKKKPNVDCYELITVECDKKIRKTVKWHSSKPIKIEESKVILLLLVTFCWMHISHIFGNCFDMSIKIVVWHRILDAYCLIFSIKKGNLIFKLCFCTCHHFSPLHFHIKHQKYEPWYCIKL